MRYSNKGKKRGQQIHLLLLPTHTPGEHKVTFNVLNKVRGEKSETVCGKTLTHDFFLKRNLAKACI